MRPRSAMFGFQTTAAARAVEAERLALLIEPGYGKTVTALTALLDLGAWPALVVAPARVAKQVWPKEPQEWEHLKNLEVQHIAGLRQVTEDWDKERFKTVPAVDVKALSNDVHVDTISYENLWWLTEQIDIGKRYRAIVFDELDKMKTPGSQRFRRMRGKGPMSIPVRLGLTGSPKGNHCLDLWGEMFMVAAERPLGSSYVEFRDRYFQAMDYYENVWELKHGPECPRFSDDKLACRCRLARECEREIHARVGRFAYALPPQVEVQVPKWLPNVIDVPMPDNVKRMAKELERELWTMLESGTELEALSRSSVAMKLRQLSAGAVYTGKGEQILDGGVPMGELFPQSSWESVHSAKLDAVDDLLDELQGEPALVFYWFKHELARLQERMNGKRIFATGASAENVTKFSRGELEVLLLHPQSAGHGIDGLQHGGHVSIMATFPWSWGMLDQSNHRLARLGQKFPFVLSHILCCGEADRRVLAQVFKKQEAEKRLFDDLIVT